MGGRVVEPVAIVEPVTTYRRGLAAVVQAGGYVSVEVENPDTDMVGASTWRLALISDAHPSAWELPGRLRHVLPEARVVLLLSSPSAGDYERAFAVGAAAALPRAAEPDDVLRALGAARNGYSMFPVSVATALFPGRVVPPSCIGDEQAQWLRDISQGRTVVSLARELGFSESTMRRRLRQAYRAIGAGSRVDAIASAARLGLLGSA